MGNPGTVEIVGLLVGGDQAIEFLELGDPLGQGCQPSVSTAEPETRLLMNLNRLGRDPLPDLV